MSSSLGLIKLLEDDVTMSRAFEDTEGRVPASATLPLSYNGYIVTVNGVDLEKIMRKCAFILPYYGKFGNYFQLFLNSCAANPDYDWLVFTDDRTAYQYPQNVHVHYETFQDMRERAQSKFEFPIALNAPYKLCDLRPMFGYIFSEYLQNYEHWGYCDCDLIFGRLDDFITEDMLNDYDKLFVLGHCSILKNNKDNNMRFMLPLHGENIYREVLQSSKGFTFDESYLSTNVNAIFMEHGYKVFDRDYSANPQSHESVFQITRFNNDLKTYCTEKASKTVYVWREGVLTRYTKNLGTFIAVELMYMHFQRRRMAVRLPNQIGARHVYKIMPGSFEPLEVNEVTPENFSSIRWKRETDIMAHRWNLLKGDIKFWRKRIVGKLLRR